MTEAEAIRGQVAVLIGEQGYTFQLVDRIDGEDRQPDGITGFRTRTVQVRASLPLARQVRTAIHELAHVILHGDLAGYRTGDLLHRRPDDDNDLLPMLEIEAETVAWLCCDVLGVGDDSHSARYLRTWAQGDDTSAVMHGPRVRAAAELILDGLGA